MSKIVIHEDKWWGDIHICAKALLERANAENAHVIFPDFNTIPVIAFPGDTEEEVYNRWSRLMAECGASYKRTDLCTQREKEQAERARIAAIKQTEVKAKLRELPDPQMNEQWAPYAELNSTDGYSKGVIDFSWDWARLMEAQIAAGKTIAECAQECSSEADSLYGITGFMYGCAVSGLSKCWIHGEELRKWHNKDFGYEGEGVVNPAILTTGEPA